MTNGMMERSDENDLAKYLVARFRMSMSGWRTASLILSSGNRICVHPCISFDRTSSVESLPHFGQFLIHRLKIESLWVKLTTEPFKPLLVLAAFWILDRFEEVAVTPGTATVEASLPQLPRQDAQMTLDLRKVDCGRNAPIDHVRVEVQLALEAGASVVPVMVGN